MLCRSLIKDLILFIIFAGDYDRSYDSFGEEEDEDYEGSPDRGGHGGYSSRGRGRGGKITRGRGRGRIGGTNEGGRGSFLNKRGAKRGGLRGGPVGKSQRMCRDRPQDTICIYFMQGKCPKVKFLSLILQYCLF